jgi:hypothetical protein
MSADIAVDLPTREGHPCGCFCFSRPSAHRLQISGSRWRAPCPTSSSPRLISNLMIWTSAAQRSESSINDGHQAPDDPRRERAPWQGTRLSLSPQPGRGDSCARRHDRGVGGAEEADPWPRDCVFVPPGVVHGAFNAGQDEARVLPISLSPSAAWELRTSTGPARRPGTRGEPTEPKSNRFPS